MCFSATASFGAGAVLAVVGVITIKKTQTSAQIPFAAIPLLFAIQQISEGFLWLSLTDPAYAGLRQQMTHAFLFFAQFLWPVWVPFAILKMEPVKKRKKLERVWLGIGAAVSAYFAYCLLTFPVEGAINEFHIRYTFGYPRILTPIVSSLYLISTVSPTLFSGIRRLWVFGVTVFASYLVTMFFYFDYFVSVWCFFAAVLSAIIFAVVRKTSQQGKTNAGSVGMNDENIIMKTGTA